MNCHPFKQKTPNMTKILKLIIPTLALASIMLPSSVLAAEASLSDLERELLQLQGLYEEMLLKVGREENYTAPTTFAGVPNVTLTCTKLDTNLRYTMVDSSTNEPIKKLQEFLKANGDYTYPSTTGFFGEETMRAVTRFQKRVGIFPADGYGVVEATTRDRIENISCDGRRADIKPLFIPSTIVGQNYATTLYTDGATGNVSIVLKDGGLPSGLSLTNIGNGQAVISGRTRRTGAYVFTVRIAGGNEDTARSYVLIVNDKDGALYGP